MSDLQQVLQAAAREGNGDESTPSGWHVDSRSSAQWAMQKLWELRQQEIEIHAEAAQVRQPLEVQIDLITAWEKKEVTRLEVNAQFFEGELIHWLAVERAADPKLKSVTLPYGTVVSRQKPDGIEIEDPERVLSHLRAQGRTEFIRVTEALDKARIKEAVLKDGELLPGVQRVEGELVYEVKIAEVAE